MSLWEKTQTARCVGSGCVKTASKYSIYGTIAKGAAGLGSAGMQLKGSWKSKGFDTSGAPKAYTIDGSY